MIEEIKDSRDRIMERITNRFDDLEKINHSIRIAYYCGEHYIFGYGKTRSSNLLEGLVIARQGETVKHQGDTFLVKNVEHVFINEDNGTTTQEINIFLKFK